MHIDVHISINLPNRFDYGYLTVSILHLNTFWWFHINSVLDGRLRIG